MLAVRFRLQRKTSVGTASGKTAAGIAVLGVAAVAMGFIGPMRETGDGPDYWNTHSVLIGQSQESIAIQFLGKDFSGCSITEAPAGTFVK